MVIAAPLVLIAMFAGSPHCVKARWMPGSTYLATGHVTVAGERSPVVRHKNCLEPSFSSSQSRPFPTQAAVAGHRAFHVGRYEKVVTPQKLSTKTEW